MVSNCLSGWGSIGFVMVDIQPSDLPPESSSVLWRFMIAGIFNIKAMEDRFLTLSTSTGKKEKRSIYVSCEMDEEEERISFT